MLRVKCELGIKGANFKFYLYLYMRQCCVVVVFGPDLEIFQQSPTGDFTAIDLLHINVTRTEKPWDQNPQVV